MRCPTKLSCANRCPRPKAAASCAAFAGPTPLIFASSLAEQRLNLPNEPYSLINCRATSIAFAPLVPVASRIATSSASLKALAPRAASRSRGRSSFGISRILSGAVISRTGKMRRARQLAAELFEQLDQRFAQAEKGVHPAIRFKRPQLALCVPNQLAPGLDRRPKRAVGRRVLEQSRDFLELSFQHQRATAFAIESRSRLEQRQHRKSKLAFAQIGPEGLAGFIFRPGNIETVVVNLIGGADLLSVIAHPPNDWLRCAANHRAQLRGAGKQRAGLHADDPEIFFARELKIEPPLGLNHFPGANLGRGPRDPAADAAVVEIGRKIQRMGKENVAEQDAERVAP